MSTKDDALAEALRSLSTFLVAEASLGDSLRRVAEITVAALPGAEFAGFTMLDDKGQPTTEVFTDQESPDIDQSQYDSGRGPCLDAWRHDRVVRLDDIAAGDGGAYPEFSATCAGHGVHSTLSLPLVAAGRALGAMNLYSGRRHGFSDDDEALGVDLAVAAAAVLANAVAYWDALELGEQLTEAMASRAVIEQAKGILMAASPGRTADDAFDLLRQASQRENIKLREVAQRIVEQRSLVDSE
ncbi:MAG TPA: GAF and ANTAR domain-containing protein [Acidimicrobiales bacterium]|nr:GAF and ANTAR domain-containing protein [Acidimicrobiales bacterium]